MAYTSRLLNAIPGIRHAFLDVHETAAFPYAELAPVKLVHGLWQKPYLKSIVFLKKKFG
ncbi:hypothetical protein ACLBPK_23180, partial [Klebsiella pneumoniae]